jgi:hypothetical protein
MLSTAWGVAPLLEISPLTAAGRSPSPHKWFVIQRCRAPVALVSDAVAILALIDRVTSELRHVPWLALSQIRYGAVPISQGSSLKRMKRSVSGLEMNSSLAVGEVHEAA